MSQVLVWKSDTDGKLFEDKAKYQKHLRVLAGQRAQGRRIAKAEAEREAFITRMGATVKSIDELEKFIADNWEWFFANGMKNALWKCDKKPKNKHKLVSLKFDVRWSDAVSNSHSCPRDGVTNWGGDTKLPNGSPAPRGYPGWTGNVKFVIDAGMSAHKKNPYRYDGYGSDYFEHTPINTGSGGSGNGQNYSYGIELFASDFPAMLEAREKAIVWNTLTDKNELEFA